MNTISTDIFWKALCQDTSSLVLVVDRAGRIQAVNQRINEFDFETPPTDMDELASCPMFIRLYQDLVGKAFESEESATADGFLRGRFVSVTCRPISGEDSVLVVVTPGTKPADHASIESAARGHCPDLGMLQTLTSREMEVLRLIGMGFSTARIAETMGRSVKTVEWHRVALGTKLSVTNRVELARIAIHAGLCLSAN